MTLSALAAGIVLSASVWMWLPPWAGLLLILIAACFWRWGRPALRPMAAALLLTLAWCGLRLFVLGDAFHPSTAWEERSASIDFTIVGDPTVIVRSEDDILLRIPARWTPVHPDSPDFFPLWFRSGRMLLEVEEGEVSHSFRVGTRWQASGRLRAQEGGYTGLFRSQWRFRPDPESLMPQKLPAWTRQRALLFRGRDFLSSRLEGALAGRDQERAVLKALLLGDRSGLERPVLDRFARTGLVHVFAVSGLHIGMLAGLLWFGLRWMRVPYRLRGWAVLPVLTFFVMFSGMRAGSLRALIMLGCLWAAPFWYRRVKVGQALALAVCILLLISPGQVAELGFQYSFLLVAGLVASASSLSRGFGEWFEADPWAPPDEQRSRRERYLWAPLRDSLVVSAVCVTLSAPLTAITFHLFSPIGLLGNLLAVPLVFLLLLTGFPALLISLLPGSATAAVWILPAELASWLLRWTAWLESVPFGWQWVRSPPLWIVVAGYGLFFLSVWMPRWRRPCLLGVLGLALFVVSQDLMWRARTELLILPTERGQAFLLRRGFHPGILIDAGSEWDAFELKKTLREQGINRLDAVFFTHPDRYHVEGWPAVSAERDSRELFGFRGDIEATASLLHGADLSGVVAGDRLSCGGWEIEVLHPPKGHRAPRADDRSLVVRFTAGFRSILVMGGGGLEVEKTLLEEQAPVAARVLLAGNPRQDPLLHEAFLQAVRPELVVFSGQGFEGVTPARREAEQRVADLGFPLLRADKADSANRIQL